MPGVIVGEVLRPTWVLLFSLVITEAELSHVPWLWFLNERFEYVYFCSWVVLLNIEEILRGDTRWLPVGLMMTTTSTTSTWSRTGTPLYNCLWLFVSHSSVDLFRNQSWIQSFCACFCWRQLEHLHSPPGLSLSWNRGSTFNTFSYFRVGFISIIPLWESWSIMTSGNLVCWTLRALIWPRWCFLNYQKALRFTSIFLINLLSMIRFYISS